MEELLFGKPVWMFISIFGRSYVEANKDKSLEEFMETPRSEFLTGEGPERFYIVSKGYELSFNQRGIKLTPLSNLDAYNSFGIEMMETAVEKTYASILKKEYLEKIKK